MVTTEAAKPVEQLQNDYELVIIVSPEVPDDAIEPITNTLTQVITGKGGTITELNRWGRKKLAYPIKHLMEGNYVLIKFKLDPAANHELETTLKITEKIIRYLLIKVD